MKIIKPYAEIVNPDDPVKHIEKCGRVCYKSEGKITADSAEKFIKNLHKRGHVSVLGHYRFIVRVPFGYGNLLDKADARFLTLTKHREGTDGYYIISASPRSFLQALEVWEGEMGSKVLTAIIGRICQRYGCDCLFNNLDYTKINQSLIGKVKVIENVAELDEKDRMKHGWFTAHIVCDRGISHQLVRHTMAAVSQESTRYCNYGGEKFGNELTFIEPCFFPDGSEQAKFWYAACEASEKCYLGLIDGLAKPEEARTVLTTSLKTEFYMTMTNEYWGNFFSLRCSEKAHPQAREIAQPLFDEARKTEPLFCK